MEKVKTAAVDSNVTEKEPIEDVVDKEKLTSQIKLKPKRISKVVTARVVSEW